MLDLAARVDAHLISHGVPCRQCGYRVHGDSQVAMLFALVQHLKAAHPLPDAPQTAQAAPSALKDLKA